MPSFKPSGIDRFCLSKLLTWQWWKGIYFSTKIHSFFCFRSSFSVRPWFRCLFEIAFARRRYRSDFKLKKKIILFVTIIPFIYWNTKFCKQCAYSFIACKNITYRETLEFCICWFKLQKYGSWRWMNSGKNYFSKFQNISYLGVTSLVMITLYFFVKFFRDSGFLKIKMKIVRIEWKK